MHASVRPAVSVNLPPTGTNTAARESAVALTMRMTVSKVNFFYGAKQTLFDISMAIATNKVTALIGPSGCGKSTLLRTLNRMHETVEVTGARIRRPRGAKIGSGGVAWRKQQRAHAQQQQIEDSFHG